MRGGTVWEFLLASRGRAVLLVVVDARGETPGRRGFKMAVTAKGDRFGTIGGGKVEHDLVEEAKGMLRLPVGKAHLRRMVHRLDSKESSGMIGGGEQTVALFPLKRSDRETLAVLSGAAAGGKGGVIVLSPRRLSFVRARKGRGRFSFRRNGGKWEYRETIDPPDRLFIVGGGHVGLALSRVMATLGFRITVLDERPKVDTLLGNRHAHERRIVRFDRVGRWIPSGGRSYVAIMTPGHLSDESVLRQLIGREFRYLGLMASRRKARQIGRALRSEGVGAERIARVRMPIGLPIGSRTPAEIAVSIAAEIVEIRNNPRKSRG